MSAVLAAELAEWRSAIRAYFAGRSSDQAVRGPNDGDLAHNPGTWEQMAEQLDLQGLLIEEALGGSGFSAREMVIAVEEMGHALYDGPFISSAVITPTILSTAGAEGLARDYLPQIASGELIAATSVAALDRTGLARASPIEAETDRGTWTLDGVLPLVLDGTDAGIVIIHAATDEEQLFVVDGGAEGLRREPVPTLDQTRRFAHLTLKRTPARRIETPDVAAVVERAVTVGALAYAAEQLGAAEAAFAITLAYVAERVQYGRPIGSYQVIKHRCAEMLVSLRLARAGVEDAAVAVADEASDADLLARAAKVTTSETFAHIAAETVQLHGGIGVTWEAAPHLYLKRAQLDGQLFGTPSQHRAQIAARLGLR